MQNSSQDDACITRVAQNYWRNLLAVKNSKN